MLWLAGDAFGELAEDDSDDEEEDTVETVALQDGIFTGGFVT